MNQKENNAGIVPPNRVHPYIPLSPATDQVSGVGSIYDFFNVPTAYRGRPNALPFRAYNLIYNEYFRDQNLQEPVEVPMNDGSDKADTYRLPVCVGKRITLQVLCLGHKRSGSGSSVTCQVETV